MRRKTGRNYDWLPIGEAAVSKPAAAGLAPGRPDEGISTPSSQKLGAWAYVCIAKLRTPKRKFSASPEGVP
jgi:hypothetical protein